MHCDICVALEVCVKVCRNWCGGNLDSAHRPMGPGDLLQRIKKSKEGQGCRTVGSRTDGLHAGSGWNFRFEMTVGDASRRSTVSSPRVLCLLDPNGSLHAPP